MSTRYEHGPGGVFAVARVCDGCGEERRMVNADGWPAAWTLRSAVPRGWSRLEPPELGTAPILHFCTACTKRRNVP